MITNITLENFKCFRKVEVNPRRITVFIGPNGTGKSGVLQALALLKQSVGGVSLDLRGPLINLHSHDQLMPRFVPATSLPIMFFEGNYRIPLSLQTGRFGSPVYFSFGAMFRNGEVIESWGETRIDHLVDERPSFTQSLEIPRRGIPRPLKIYLDNFEIDLEAEHAIAATTRIASIRPENRAHEIQGEIHEILLSATRTLNYLRFVPVTRGLVQSRYDVEFDSQDDIEFLSGLPQQGQHIANNMATSNSVESKISSWMYRVTGLNVGADLVHPSYQMDQLSVEVSVLTSNSPVNIVAEGFGTNTLIL